MKRFIPILFSGLIVACSNGSQDDTAVNPSGDFLSQISAHCGKAFEGKVVSTDEVDAQFASQELVMHVRECTDGEIRIPFHVGEDRSRTWVITSIEDGLRLKHDHRHEDGEEDAVTQYGGDSNLVTAMRAEFPVDQYSIDMFNREGLTASVTNIWAVEITDDVFAYELRRENRFFRVEFDLSESVSPPPPPWGATG